MAIAQREVILGARQAIIDVDIHPALDPARVAALLPEPWRTRYRGGNTGPGYLGLVIGTDADSEGLNVQRIGALINLDLP